MTRVTVRGSSFHASSNRLRVRVASACAAGLAFACTAWNPVRTEAQEEAPVDGLTLTWDAPAECPGRAHLLSRIHGHLPVDYRADDGITAQARVQRVHGRYVLALRLSGSAGEAEREASAASCAALSDLTALLVALALDPAASSEARSPTETAPTPAAEVPSPSAPSADRQLAAPNALPAPRTPKSEAVSTSRAPDPSSSSESEDEDEPTSGVSFTHGEPSGFAVDFGLAFALDLGTLPQRPSPGGRVDAGIRLGRLRAAVGLALWPAFETPAELYPGARLLGRGVLGELALGLELAHSPLSVVGSALLEAGEVAIETRGITRPSRGEATWFGAGIRLQAGYRLWKGLGLRIDLSVLAPFSRPSWFVHLADGDVTVFTVSPIAMRGAAGLSYVID